MNKLIILLMAMLIFASGSGIGVAKEVTVNPTDSIKAAVNNASSGDIIIVKPGVYNENIKITTPNLIIRSESGNPEDTIIRTDSYGFNVTATASNTTISGFKIDSAETGIKLDRCSGCTISNNEISGNRANKDKFGIQLYYSNANTLLNNILNLNVRGIDCIHSDKNRIIDNIALNNSQYGMWISVSNYNDISGNTVNGCGDGRQSGSGGIHLNSATGNIISGNIVAFTNTNGYGLFECRACRKNLVYNNYINNDRNANIQTTDTTWNVTKTSGTNIVGGPFIGGNFWATPQDKGFSQVTPDNDKDGFTDSPYIYQSGNIADHLPLVLISSPQQPIQPVSNFSANVTSGYSPLDVQFTDLSQNAVSWSWDFDNNGQQESNVISPVYTYRVPGNYTVNLTVSNENGKNSKLATIIVLEQPITVFPVADFSASVTSGYAPLDVQFTDLSQNATSRTWDFGDGSPLSAEQNLTHTYSTAGTYTVSLTAINGNGTSPTPKTATIAVSEQNHPGPSSGGGGAGGSPEPAKNVEVKEISQAFITNGKSVNFDFAREATCVVSVNFDAKKTAGKTSAIAEQLKGKSTLVSDLNAGEVYKYFNVWVGTGGFATSKNIENPAVCFKVDKSWLQDKNIDQASITLSRYSDKKWSQLPTTLLKEDDRYLYFTAETPEFSFFAITGKAGEKETVTEIKPETDTSKPEQNITASEIEQGQKSEQENITNTSGPDQENTTGIPGFETLSAVACILIVFLNRKR